MSTSPDNINLVNDLRDLHYNMLDRLVSAMYLLKNESAIRRASGEDFEMLKKDIAVAINSLQKSQATVRELMQILSESDNAAPFRLSA